MNQIFFEAILNIICTINYKLLLIVFFISSIEYINFKHDKNDQIFQRGNLICKMK